MSNLTNMSTAAPCSGVPAVSIAGDTWRDRIATRRPRLTMQHPSVFQPTHNSIVSALGGTSVMTGVVAYGADKQAAPPRGVPR